LADWGEKTMNQQRMILGLATLAVVGAGVWAWYGNSPSPEAAEAQSMNASPFRRVDTPAPEATQADPAVTAAPQPAADPADEDDSTQSAAAPQSAEPPSVDTPEQAQRKFAHGSKAEAEQI
jgi:hypothetical protein